MFYLIKVKYRQRSDVILHSDDVLSQLTLVSCEMSNEQTAFSNKFNNT